MTAPLRAERAAAFDRVVGPFESFDRDDRSVFHDHSLADVEPAISFAIFQPKSTSCFLAMMSLGPAIRPACAQRTFEKSRGRQKIDIYF
jgi:hypothetical protein